MKVGFKVFREQNGINRRGEKRELGWERIFQHIIYTCMRFFKKKNRKEENCVISCISRKIEFL